MLQQPQSTPLARPLSHDGGPAGPSGGLHQPHVARPSSRRGADVWLSQLTFQMRDRATRWMLGDLQDLHRFVVRAFPGLTRAEAGALHDYTRAPGGLLSTVLVQSAIRPDWSFLPAEYTGASAQVKDISMFWALAAAGARYRFRVTASPCSSVVVGERRGRPLRRRRPLTDPDDQLAWLQRHVSDAVALNGVMVSSAKLVSGNRKNDPVTFTQVTYSGVLTVTDADRLREIAVFGIGPGKAYGQGLLRIAKAS